MITPLSKTKHEVVLYSPLNEPFRVTYASKAEADFYSGLNKKSPDVAVKARLCELMRGLKQND